MEKKMLTSTTFQWKRIRTMNICFVLLYVVIHVLMSRFWTRTDQLVKQSGSVGSSYGDLQLQHSEAKPSSLQVNDKRPVTIWSNDFHIGPIKDVKDLLEPLGVHFIDKSLSGHCNLTNTCAKDLKVLNRTNGFYPSPEERQKFYEAYVNDSVMKRVDAFICFHPSAMCELFMPFGKSLIVVASTRYEMAREDPQLWKKWNNNLLTISKQDKNTVAANNYYDSHYIKYFTGIEPVLLPSYCGYTNASYKPTKKHFLLAPIHKSGFEPKFLHNFSQACANVSSSGCNVTLKPLRLLYPHYNYTDLVSHPGIVYAPYQVSTMSIFEQYAMNIPLFFPSVDLLAEWQLKHQLMIERTWDGVHRIVANESHIPGIPSQRHIPDPNCETNITAIKYWIKYADFYKRPHIVVYDSFRDLVNKLNAVDLGKISEKMRAYNAVLKKELLGKWEQIISKIQANRT